MALQRNKDAVAAMRAAQDERDAMKEAMLGLTQQLLAGQKPLLCVWWEHSSLMIMM